MRLQSCMTATPLQLQFLQQVILNDHPHLLMMVYVAEKYIEWELAIDNIFSQCCMCEWRKIQNATSILTDSASVWWDKLCQSDKPRTWKTT